jgi:hypothetical protein
VTTVAAPTADIEARLRDFALALLGGTSTRELDPGPAPSLTAEGSTPSVENCAQLRTDAEQLKTLADAYASVPWHAI